MADQRPHDEHRIPGLVGIQSTLPVTKRHPVDFGKWNKEVIDWLPAGRNPLWPNDLERMAGEIERAQPDAKVPDWSETMTR